MAIDDAGRFIIRPIFAYFCSINNSRSSQFEVSVPCHRHSSQYTYGRRAFAVAGPTVWNSLPEDMRDPEVSEDSYRQSPKTFLFAQYWCVQLIRGFSRECAI